MNVKRYQARISLFLRQKPLKDVKTGQGDYTTPNAKQALKKPYTT